MTAPATLDLNFSVSVAGTDVDLQVDASKTLGYLAAQALAKSGVTANRTGLAWELRDNRGTLLDSRRPISDYGFSGSSRLYMCVPVGYGG